MVPTCLRHVFVIESFIEEIPAVNQVFMNWDTDSLIEFLFYFILLKSQAMNILSEPLVNYVILWENRDLQFIKKAVILNLSRIAQVYFTCCLLAYCI